MSPDEQTNQALRPPAIAQFLRQGLRPLAHRALWRLAPAYARRRSARAGLPALLARVQDEVEHLGERHDERLERLEDLARELILTAESLRRATADVDVAAKALRGKVEAMDAELNALPYVAGEVFEAMETPAGEAVGYRAAAPLRGGEGDYVDFEELFRGPAARVTDSQRPYLPLVREHQPVLDLGCGRGEFLALLAGEGIAGRGVDSDRGMVDHCLALGLDVTLADANAHLESLEDASLGVVFSVQLIEHLPYAELRRLFALARAKLRPGGLLIAETVNPHRVPSLKTFWVDLTHRHPIFPEVALALSALAGFEPAYVFAPSFASYEQARFSAPAYALVATAPADGGRQAD
jgi:SAM-dependent methyltransferase